MLPITLGTNHSVIDFADTATGKTSNGKAIKVTPRGDTAAGNRGKFGTTGSLIRVGGEDKYIASVWVKIPDATTAVKVAFGFGSSATTSDREQFTVQPNTWTKLEVIQDVTADMGHLGVFEAGETRELDIYLDDFSVQKAIIAGSNAGDSSAEGSNTGDVVPVALIATAIISASALVIVARRKRED